LAGDTVRLCAPRLGSVHGKMHWISVAVGLLFPESETVFWLASGIFMPSCKAVFVVVVLGFICTQSVTAQTGFGAQGAETEPGRMQQWLVPSPAMDAAAHAL